MAAALLGVIAASTVAPDELAVLGTTSVVTANTQNGPTAVTFPAVSAGSRLFLGFALGTEDGPTANSDGIVSSIAMTGVTWTRAESQTMSVSKFGVDLWTGVVASGGATSASITHAPGSHLAVCGIEVNQQGTKVGSKVTAEKYNDATHEMGEKTYGSSIAGIALGVLYFDPYGPDGNVTFTPPSGWTTAGFQGVRSTNVPIMWFGYKLLEGVASESPTVTASRPNPFGQLSMHTAYAV